MPRSSGTIILLFVTSALTVFGAESFVHRNDDDDEWDENDRYFSPDSTTQPSSTQPSTTQPYNDSRNYPYYYDRQYNHWWYFGFHSHSGGMHGYDSASHGSHSGTSRGGFGSTGHAHGGGHGGS